MCFFYYLTCVGRKNIIKGWIQLDSSITMNPNKNVSILWQMQLWTWNLLVTWFRRKSESHNNLSKRPVIGWTVCEKGGAHTERNLSVIKPNLSMWSTEWTTDIQMMMIIIILCSAWTPEAPLRRSEQTWRCLWPRESSEGSTLKRSALFQQLNKGANYEHHRWWADPLIDYLNNPFNIR